LPYWRLGTLALSQDNVVEAQDWFRKALMVEPDNPAIARSIALNFYRFGLLSEGDRWSERVRAMAPGRVDLILDLEIMAAAAAQDQDRLIKVLEEGIALTISAEGYNGLTTHYYPSVMSAQGRSQEALDYLTELIPELQDYSKLIRTSTFEQWFQIQSFPLQQDVLDQEGFERLAGGFVEIVEAEYPWVSDTDDPGTNTMNRVTFQTWLGDYDQALELIRKGHTDWPVYSGKLEWQRLQDYPWFERYRNDPEVASAIDQHEQKKARIADELREMVKRPEWQL
jgi:tetratricopeptide (TPR) repeat protein